MIERDTLKGDIYVVGGFDPEFDDEALDSLVGKVSRLPFSVVQGKIYGDVSMKDSLYWGSGCCGMIRPILFSHTCRR